MTSYVFINRVGYRVPLDLRQLLGAPSGAVSGAFDTFPATRYGGDRSFFAQVTPFNLQIKMGHRNNFV